MFIEKIDKYTLVCDFCGYKENRKKSTFKTKEPDLYYALKHCELLLCPCKKCRNKYTRPTQIKKGLVKYETYPLSGWTLLLTEKDASCVQQIQRTMSDGDLFGVWSKVMTPSIEEIQSIAKAKQIKNYCKNYFKYYK